VSESRFAFTSEIGGSNLVYNLLAKEKIPYKIFAQGPSLESLEKRGVDLVKGRDIPKFLSEAQEVYIALGRDTSETKKWFTFLTHVKTSKHRLIGVLDNWVHYEERVSDFQLDEFIVFDSYADKYARSILPTSQISTVTNHYLSSLKEEVYALRVSNKSILLIGNRPNDYSFSKLAPTHLKIPCVCAHLARISSIYSGYSITYRAHPANRLSLECRNSRAIQELLNRDVLEISDPLESLGSVLARSSIVFGPHGYALFMSQELGLETYQTTRSNEKWHGPQFAEIEL
jgi:hypothetical protein